MSIRYEATLITGRKVVFEELSSEQQLLALGAAGDHQTPAQARWSSVVESIRLMVREAEDKDNPGGGLKPVSYSQIEGSKIDQVFSAKEISQLSDLYMEVHGTGGEPEKKALLATIKMRSGEN